MKNINMGGIVIGGIAWLSIIWYASTQISCLQTRTCSGDDLIIFAAIGVGMLGPAWLVALISSSMFNK